MSFIYDWRGMPQAGVRASELGRWTSGNDQPAAGDWPAVWPSGPERGDQASYMPTQTLRSGPMPAGDITDLFTPNLLVLGAAAAAFWYFCMREPHPRRSGGSTKFGEERKGPRSGFQAGPSRAKRPKKAQRGSKIAGPRDGKYGSGGFGQGVQPITGSGFR